MNIKFNNFYKNTVSYLWQNQWTLPGCTKIKISKQRTV